MTKKVKFAVEDMTCISCANNLEKLFKKENHIKIVVSYLSKKIIAEYNDEYWNEEKIIQKISTIGYKARI